MCLLCRNVSQNLVRRFPSFSGLCIDCTLRKGSRADLAQALGGKSMKGSTTRNTTYKSLTPPNRSPWSPPLSPSKAYASPTRGEPQNEFGLLFRGFPTGFPKSGVRFQAPGVRREGKVPPIQSAFGGVPEVSHPEPQASNPIQRTQIENDHLPGPLRPKSENQQVQKSKETNH